MHFHKKKSKCNVKNTLRTKTHTPSKCPKCLAVYDSAFQGESRLCLVVVYQQNDRHHMPIMPICLTQECNMAFKLVLGITAFTFLLKPHKSF